MNNARTPRCLQAREELLLIFFFLLSLDEAHTLLSSVITFFLPNISGKNKGFPVKDKCHRRHLPEVDEMKITGGALRPAGSTCDVLNLCSAISSFP